MQIIHFTQYVLQFTLSNAPKTCQIFVKKSLGLSPQPRDTGAMSKIIRRTLIVTITETWTIGWPDGTEPYNRVFRKISLVELPAPVESDSDLPLRVEAAEPVCANLCATAQGPCAIVKF